MSRVQQLEAYHELPAQIIVGTLARCRLDCFLAACERTSSAAFAQETLAWQVQIEERSQLYMSTLLARRPDTSFITGLCIFAVLSQGTEPTWEH